MGPLIAKGWRIVLKKCKEDDCDTQIGDHPGQEHPADGALYCHEHIGGHIEEDFAARASLPPKEAWEL